MRGMELRSALLGLILPLCCYYLDCLDSDRSYTLGFVCEGSKK